MWPFIPLSAIDWSATSAALSATIAALVFAWTVRWSTNAKRLELQEVWLSTFQQISAELIPAIMNRSSTVYYMAKSKKDANYQGVADAAISRSDGVAHVIERQISLLKLHLDFTDDTQKTFWEKISETNTYGLSAYEGETDLNAVNKRLTELEAICWSSAQSVVSRQRQKISSMMRLFPKRSKSI